MLRLDGDVHLGIAAGLSGIYRLRNFFDVQSNNGPSRSAQHHQGYSAASKGSPQNNLYFSTAGNHVVQLRMEEMQP